MSASSGTLIATALESAGYRAQQVVLTDLITMLDSVGALLYAGVVVVAIAMSALQLRFDRAVWLLVGPGLFFFVIKTPVTAVGVDWQFGSFEGEKSEVESVLGESYSSDVSWVFHRYNELISSTFQELIKVLTRFEVKDQMLFMVRQRMLDEVMRSEFADNPGLLALINEGLSNHCIDVMNAGRTLARGRFEPTFRGSPEYMHALLDYSNKIDVTNIKLEDPMAVNYLVQLFIKIWYRKFPGDEEALPMRCEGTPDPGSAHAALQAMPADNELADPMRFMGDPGTQTVGAFVSPIAKGAMSCRQIWCWAGLGLAMEAHDFTRDVEEKFVTDYMEKSYADGEGGDSRAIYKEIWHEIAVKLSPHRVVFNDLNGTDDAIVDLEMEEPDASMIPMIIAGVMLRKIMAKDPRSQMFSSFARHSGIQTKPFQHPRPESMADQAQYQTWISQYYQSASLRYEVFTASLVLPYVQGMLLYVLAFTFPFFAMLLLIPSAAGYFLQWMALWAWVKFWDVGWAIVMVADDVLWKLMPHGDVIIPFNKPTTDGNSVDGLVLAGPVTFFDTAFRADPTYSLENYYFLIGGMVFAVPIISAQVVLGAKAAIAGGITGQVVEMSQQMGGGMAGYRSIEVASLLNNYRAARSVDFVKRNLGKDVAHLRYLRDVAAEQKRQEAESQSLWGWIGGGLLVLAGAVVVGLTWWTGVGGVAGVALMAGGVTMMAGGAYYAYDSQIRAVDLERAANVNIKDYVEQKADWYLSMANYDPQFRMYEQLRAGATHRGEFWNTVDLPASQAKKMVQALTAHHAMIADMEGKKYGEPIGVALSSLEAFFSVRSGGG